MIKFVCVGLEKEEKRGERSKGTWEKRKDWGECAAFEMRFAFLLWGKGERDDFIFFCTFLTKKTWTSNHFFDVAFNFPHISCGRRMKYDWIKVCPALALGRC
jgi:hypothetical protein